MSVINEALDNLKQGKKRASRSLNPSSSVYCEKVLKSEKPVFEKKSYLIPISFAMLVALFFYISQLYNSYSSDKNQLVKSSQPNTETWFKTNLRNHSQSLPVTPKAINQSSAAENADVKNLYYNAMSLLNEGKDQQALESLQKIVEKYPNFAPAQNVYATLKAQ